MTGIISLSLNFFSNGFLNNVLLDFLSLLSQPRKRVGMGKRFANPSTKSMKQTRSLVAGCQDPFLSNGSRLSVFIQASLSCLHLIGPGKVYKGNGGLHSRYSLFFLQLPSTSRLCSVEVSLFHLLIYFWHDERYVLITTMT